MVDTEMVAIGIDLTATITLIGDMDIALIGI
jgi:hypothetical protein